MLDSKKLQQTLIKIGSAQQQIVEVKKSTHLAFHKDEYSRIIKKGLDDSIALISNTNFKLATGFSKIASSGDQIIQSRKDFTVATKNFIDDRILLFIGSSLDYKKASVKDNYLKKVRDLDSYYVSWMKETRAIWLELLKEGIENIDDFTSKEAKEILINQLKQTKEYDEFKEGLEDFQNRLKALIALGKNLSEKDKNSHDISSWLKNLESMLDILLNVDSRFERLILESIHSLSFTPKK